jgi:uncharacterized membrane protein
MESVATTSVARRTSDALNAILVAVVLAVGILFVVEAGWSTSWYAAFKAVHVAFAVLWIGGGLLLTILAVAAQRRDDAAEIATIARQAAFAGEKLFAPAGLIVFAMGIAMIINGDLGWGHFWVIAGLIGYATTFVTGVAVLSPMAKKISASIEATGAESPQTQALIHRILLIARVDVTVLVLVVLDMVTKPFA